jgi:hypothetical protein
MEEAGSCSSCYFWYPTSPCWGTCRNLQPVPHLRRARSSGSLRPAGREPSGRLRGPRVVRTHRVRPDGRLRAEISHLIWAPVSKSLAERPSGIHRWCMSHGYFVEEGFSCHRRWGKRSLPSYMVLSQELPRRGQAVEKLLHVLLCPLFGS